MPPLSSEGKGSTRSGFHNFLDCQGSALHPSLHGIGGVPTLGVVMANNVETAYGISFVDGRGMLVFCHSTHPFASVMRQGDENQGRLTCGLDALISFARGESVHVPCRVLTRPKRDP